LGGCRDRRLASLLLHLVVPGALKDMVAGEMEGEPLTAVTGFMFTALVGSRW
jgi:hypothetical protein